MNEVQFAYNSFGQLVADYQEHGGVVNTSTLPKVEYQYADGSAGHNRPTKMIYPNGRILRYDYRSGTEDAINRISLLADEKDGAVWYELADYWYLGLGDVVIADIRYPKLYQWVFFGTRGMTRTGGGIGKIRIDRSIGLLRRGSRSWFRSNSFPSPTSGTRVRVSINCNTIDTRAKSEADRPRPGALAARHESGDVSQR